MPRPPPVKDKPAARGARAAPQAGGAKAGAQAAGKAAVKPTAPKPSARRLEVAFPKKSQPPTVAAFAARLPLPLGKRLEAVRAFLLKQEGVSEDVFFYGPRTGWALRYLAEGLPLCSLHLHGEGPLGLLALDAAAMATVDWKALSPVAQRARRQAHGSPAQLWLDVPLDGEGVNDFKALLRAKLANLDPG
jgi:hypothetical protein